MTASLSLVILTLILFVVVMAAYDARARHNELIRLLNDLATMLGEMFDRERKE